MMNKTDRALIMVATVLVLVVLIGRPLVGWVIGPQVLGPGMPWGHGASGPAFGGWNGPWALVMGLGGLMMLAFWGALIAGVILLLRFLSRSGPQPSARPDSQAGAGLDILKRRYAAGELAEAQYAEMRQVLER